MNLHGVLFPFLLLIRAGSHTGNVSSSPIRPGPFWMSHELLLILLQCPPGNKRIRVNPGIKDITVFGCPAPSWQTAESAPDSGDTPGLQRCAARSDRRGGGPSGSKPTTNRNSHSIKWLQMTSLKHISFQAAIPRITHHIEADGRCMTHHIGANRHNSGACSPLVRVQQTWHGTCLIVEANVQP